MSHLIRFLVFLAIAILVTGCKVAVIVVEGGEVRSIASGTCAEGAICIVEVNDTNFSDAFTAVPKQGWQFIKWHSGEGFLCGGSNDPRCIISTKGTAGNAGIESVIASDQTFYIMPIFEPGLATLTVDGKEWAQVDQFTNLSWNDINAVCPAGVCSGVLNGYDMTGWTWASVDDVNALFNHYIGSDALGPGPDRLEDDSCSSVREFFSDGFRSADPGWLLHKAATRTVDVGGEWIFGSHIGMLLPDGSCYYSKVSTYEGLMIDYHEGRSGWWFWRSI